MRSIDQNFHPFLDPRAINPSLSLSLSPSLKKVSTGRDLKSILEESTSISKYIVAALGPNLIINNLALVRPRGCTCTDRAVIVPLEQRLGYVHRLRARLIETLDNSLDDDRSIESLPFESSGPVFISCSFYSINNARGVHTSFR